MNNNHLKTLTKHYKCSQKLNSYLRLMFAQLFIDYGLLKEMNEKQRSEQDLVRSNGWLLHSG